MNTVTVQENILVQRGKVIFLKAESQENTKELGAGHLSESRGFGLNACCLFASSDVEQVYGKNGSHPLWAGLKSTLTYK